MGLPEAVVKRARIRGIFAHGLNGTIPYRPAAVQAQLFGRTVSQPIRSKVSFMTSTSAAWRVAGRLKRLGAQARRGFGSLIGLSSAHLRSVLLFFGTLVRRRILNLH